MFLISFVIVVASLNALMKDQVNLFSKRGLTAAFINSYSVVDDPDLPHRAAQGLYQLVYIGSEMLINQTFYREMLQNACTLPYHRTLELRSMLRTGILYVSTSRVLYAITRVLQLVAPKSQVLHKSCIRVRPDPNPREAVNLGSAQPD